MGIMRKATSISTLGIVDFRSDQERIARFTKQTRNAARLHGAQNARMMELERQQIAALNRTVATVLSAVIVAASVSLLQPPLRTPTTPLIWPPSTPSGSTHNSATRVFYRRAKARVRCSPRVPA